MEYYERVMKECPEQRDTCADAYTWIGKVHLKEKAFEKARALFMDFLNRFPEFPADAVRNIDLAAGSYLTEGRRDEAAALLEDWRSRFESLMGKSKVMDKRIAKALERMKTPDRLKE
jgi:hypothetical protein